MSSLDPENWETFRALAHRALDEMIEDVMGIRAHPPWQPIPAAVRAAIADDPLPRAPADPRAVYDAFRENIAPYAVDNRNPRFFGWVHGAGTMTGMLAALLAGGMNVNAGGRDHAAIEVERRVIRWWCEVFGFPATASGYLTTGTSMANLIGVLVARRSAAGAAVRSEGLAAEPLAGYTSPEAHASLARAFDLAGLGTDALRIFSDVPALCSGIASDRAAGMQPFMIIATAGSASTGSMDDLQSLADVARDEKLWFHVDGAFGALVQLAPELRHLVAGIERADSLAFDLHKWLHVPYDSGAVLVRDGALHQATFADHAPYLARMERGTAGGEPWLTDFGPELSRGFRALGVWFTMKTYGLDRFGELIARQCALARALGERIAATPQLELLTPVTLNIVCFRYRASDEVNAELAIEVQERGIAVPSTTRVDGKLALRMNIMNHRTTQADLDAALDGVLAVGAELLGRSTTA
ncbi:MAG TPA: pyridoxal-dependent decarboxylase [Candidatus Lustribacter sp.]|jgi:glutamate/tyrosine decarboxylase-like PLP-dependent enzyme|nr:pyridoxal-dependent decarboxylase [Candidatus Lustribacter sp.]